VITDSSGVIKAESDYRPFGAELQIVNNDPNDYKFTGKKRDVESGLDFFGARYYSSGFGRFVTPDWSAGPATVPYAHLENPQTLNLYSYIDNNPVNSIDPDGHAAREYMVYNAGGFGPNMFVGGPTVEIDWSGTLDTTTNTLTIVSVQTSVVTWDFAGALNGTTEQSQTPGSAQNATPELQRDATVSTERFRTRDAAAMAAEKAGLKMTKDTNQGKTNWEFGGWIVKDKRGYGYTIPMIGAVRGQADIDNMLVPVGFTKVAGYHTHPDETSRVGQGFSTGKLGDTGWADRNNFRFYVADVYTRNLYRYDPGVTKVRGYDQVTGDLVGHIPE
jgi:RHS repeat-associated protein